MKRRNLALVAAGAAVVSLSVSSAARAQSYSYRYAYVHEVTGELKLQRASELEPEAGGINVPLVPGDRLWTGAGSRAEIRFADGTVLRMDEYTKLDLIDFESEQTVRVWNGSVILKLAEPRANVRIDTASGSVYPAPDGQLRIDVRNGEVTTLSVNRGVAELVSDAGSVLVRSGQRSVLEPGRRPDSPFPFNTAHFDAFDAWSDERERYASATHTLAGELPREVHHYASNLSHHGEWHHDTSYGHVWYPQVHIGWAPYRHGAWRYTSFGYTWISHEPWGWAPYHYGRWGHGARGWFWIPGSYWSPAWVSWAFGPTWVGWSPLGYYDRSVFVFNDFLRGRGSRFRGGKAVPRHVLDHGAGWNFARRRDFQRGGSAALRLRPAQVRGMASNVRLLDSGAVLDRALVPRAVGGAAISRSAARAPLRPANRNAATPRAERRRVDDPSRGLGSSRTGTTRTFTSRPRDARRGPEAGSSVRRRETPAAREGDRRNRDLSTRGSVVRRGAGTTAGTARSPEPRSGGAVRNGASRARSGTSRVIRTPSSSGSTSNGRSRATPGSTGVGRERSGTPPRRTTSPPRSRGREFFERSGSQRDGARSPARARGRGSEGERSKPSRPGVGSSSSTPRSRGTVRRGTSGLRSPGATTRGSGTIQRRNPPSRGSGTIQRGSSPSRGSVRGAGATRGSSSRGAAATRSNGNRGRKKN